MSSVVRGSLVALVSPMHQDGSLDLVRYAQLIDWHVSSGTAAIVAVGTTGESATVSFDEHADLIRLAVSQAAGRIPVIAGAGANSTCEAVELAAFAKSVGAFAALQVVPYYNRPTQEGLYRHFTTIAESVDLPTILYNVPSRTGVDLSNETVVRLSHVPGIIGLKDATGSVARSVDLALTVPQDFAIYGGNDDCALGVMLSGGVGVISVAANVAPLMMAQLCQAALSGDVPSAKALNARLFPLFRALSVESNPIPVKWVLQQMKLIEEGGVRLPLLPLSTRYHAEVLAVLEGLDLIKKER